MVILRDNLNIKIIQNNNVSPVQLFSIHQVKGPKSQIFSRCIKYLKKDSSIIMFGG